jgi:hypothetical protein
MKRQEGALTLEVAGFVDTFSHLATLLPSLLAKLCAEIEQTEARMHALAEQGLVRAVPDWRASRRGDYLTLVYPAEEGGKRPRKYIGRDPIKVQEALNAIGRGEEYDRLQRRLYEMLPAPIVAATHISKAYDSLLNARPFS